MAQSGKTVIKPGDNLYIDASNSSCSILQPNIAPTDYTTSMGSSYTGTLQTTHWSYCLRNLDSVGKVFILEVSEDPRGLISKSSVTVTS